LQKKTKKILNYERNFISIILSLYSASKILQKEVQPFFDQNITSSFKCSPQIIDSYDGTLHSVQQLIDKNQYTFIYLYADWCARSKRFRELIADLSCLHSNEIRFIAINCFVADCQKTFNLAKYPQVLVQTRDAGLYFYRGPFELNHFSNYLKLIQMPLQRIDDFDQFIQFIIKNDVIKSNCLHLLAFIKIQFYF